MPKPGREINSGELAEFFGVTTNTVRLWRKAGMPIKSERGRGAGNVFDSAEVIRWLIAQRTAENAPAEGSRAFPTENARGLTYMEQVKAENMQADTRLKDVRLAQLRGEVAPIELITDALAKTGDQICAIFETIPVKIRRRNPKLTATDLEIVKRELTKALNIAASIMPDLDEPFADR